MLAIFRLLKLALVVALLGSGPVSAFAADWAKADVDKAFAAVAANKPELVDCLKQFKTVMSHDVQQVDVNKDGINELIVRTFPAAFGPGPSQGAMIACFGDFGTIDLMVSDGKGGWTDNIGYPLYDITFHDRPDSAWPDVELLGKMGCAPIYRYYKDQYTLWKTCNDGGQLIFADAQVDWAVPHDFGADSFGPKPYPAANTEGGEFLHNGSTMYVNPARGVISYKQPKRSIARTVGEGDVVLQAKPWNPEEPNRLIEATAYTFKKGCDPAPYFVVGHYDDAGSLIFRGAAPMRDKRSCAIKGYTMSSGNAELVFTSTTPSLRSWIGSFAGDCGNDNRFQCLLEIDTKDGALAVTLDVANRHDDKDVKCHLTGTFEASGSEIRGGFAQAPGARFVLAGYDLRLVGVPKSTCGVKLSGVFQAYGD